MKYFYLKIYCIMSNLLFFPLYLFSAITFAAIVDKSGMCNEASGAGKSHMATLCAEEVAPKISDLFTADKLSLMRSNIDINDIVSLFGSALCLLSNAEVDACFEARLNSCNVEKEFDCLVYADQKDYGFLNGVRLEGSCPYVEAYIKNKIKEEPYTISSEKSKALTCISNIFVLTTRFQYMGYDSQETKFDNALLSIINDNDQLRKSIKEKLEELPQKPKLERSVVFGEGFYNAEFEEVISYGNDVKSIYVMELPVMQGNDKYDYYKYAELHRDHFKCLVDESNEKAKKHKRLDPLNKLDFIPYSHVKSVVVVFGPSDMKREYNIKVGLTPMGFNRFYKNNNYAKGKKFEARILISAKTPSEDISTSRYFMAQSGGFPCPQKQMYTASSYDDPKNPGNVFSFKTQSLVQSDAGYCKVGAINDENNYTSILVGTLGGHYIEVMDPNQADSKAICDDDPRDYFTGISETKSSGVVTKSCSLSTVQYADSTQTSEIQNLRVYAFHTDKALIADNISLIEDDIYRWWEAICKKNKWDIGSFSSGCKGKLMQ